MKPGSIELRTVIKERLIPHIHSRGFQFDAREIHKHDAYGHLMRRFLRWDGNRLELLDIQFDKRGRAKFVFNVGVAPPEGVDDYLGHHSQLETDISNIPKHGRLYAGNAYFMRWFSIPLLRIPLIRTHQPRTLSSTLFSYFRKLRLGSGMALSGRTSEYKWELPARRLRQSALQSPISSASILNRRHGLDRGTSARDAASFLEATLLETY
ncbi:MAG TPA: hypothetical protein VGY56_21375 [Verrucomicrobiae bacterium]|nr:hypothetical protein [Verrucomicrobiae bacterium]